MRKISLQLLSAIMLGTTFTPAAAPKAHAQEVVTSYQTFYDQLSPYGQWISDAQYGDVWVPNVAAGYRPYATSGHWAMTEYGNMWVSEEPYAWACYHYGRWTYNPYYGWVWVPGHEWAPAWVSWRSGNGYYGWAPMEPGFEAGGSYQCPDNYWVFVSPEYLYHPYVYNYYDASRNFYYCQHTVYIHDTYEDRGMRYNYGPRKEVIEREAHQPVQVYQVANVRSPRGVHESAGVVQVYRPTIKPESQRTARPANLVTARQPVGRGMDIPGGQEKAQPAFRQEMERHPNNYPGNATRGAQPMQPGARNQPQTDDQSASRPQRFRGESSMPQQNSIPQRNGMPATNQQRFDRQPLMNNAPQRDQQAGPQRVNQQPSNQQQPQRAQPQMQQPRQQPQMQQQQRVQPQQARPTGTQTEGEGRRR